MSTPPSPAHISATDFVTIPSRDLAVSSEFYGTALGLRRSVYLPDRHYSEFETGNLTLSVINAEGMGLEHHVSRNPLALHVDDVAAARAALMLHHRYAPRVTDPEDQSGS